MFIFKLREIGLLFLWILCLSACQNVPSSKANLAPVHFDLKAFFEKEVKHLERLNPTVQKSITVAEKIETKSLKDVDWRRELGLFLSSDLNKPAWRDLYEVDTIYNDNTQNLIYQAKTDKPVIQSMHITQSIQSNDVESIVIKKYNENILYSNYELIEYNRHSYKIENEQKLVFKETDRFLIEAKW